MVLTLVTRTRERTRGVPGWTLRRILGTLGLTKSRYREWVHRGRADALADRPSGAPALEAILPEEKTAVLAYALGHPKDGYRRLAWQMIDADVAYLSPTSVYRILRDAEVERAGGAISPPGARGDRHLDRGIQRAPTARGARVSRAGGVLSRQSHGADDGTPDEARAWTGRTAADQCRAAQCRSMRTRPGEV